MLNWNGRDITAACLESVRKISYQPYEVIVVDNGSSDGSRDHLQEKFPWITLLRSETNLGFTGGNNLGMKEAASRNCDYYLLLNNDTIVAPDFLDELINEVEQHDDVGMANPKIYFFDEPQRLWYAGGTISFFRGGKHLGLKQIDSGQFDSTREVIFLTGCAFLIKREVVEQVGFLDDRLFIHAEDLDWSMRVRKAGYKGLYVPKARIWHMEGVDSKKNEGNAFRNYMLIRNITFVFRKHFSPTKFICFCMYFVFLWGPFRTIRSALRGEFSVIPAMWKGFGDSRTLGDDTCAEIVTGPVSSLQK